jgi:hypothetical protein
MARYYPVNADDPEMEIQPASFEELQKIVGGYVEVVELDLTRRRPRASELHSKECDRAAPGDVLVVNEDGKLQQLAQNERATSIWFHVYGGGWAHDYVAGNAVFLNEEEAKRLLG